MSKKDDDPISKDLKYKLINALSLPVDGFKVVSLSIIRSNEISGGYSEGDDVEIIYGDQNYYEEELCGLKF